MISVRWYRREDRLRWDAFLEGARTRTILFARSFMDYHADRFTDASLLVLDGDAVVAVFPANRTGDTMVSHAGLTFGGLVVARDEDTRHTLACLSAVLQKAAEAGVRKILLKQSPSFYNVASQDAVDYGLFLAGARIYRVDIALAIDQRALPKASHQERRRRAIRKAEKAGVTVAEDPAFEAFWTRALVPNLEARFGVQPVHSLGEITKLAADNPGRVRQLNAWAGDTLLAGCTVFASDEVAHAQYISATDEGRKSGAIDLLFHHLITETFSDKHYFDFGIVNEAEGRAINLGLLDWKEGFGAQAYAHRFYELDPMGYAGIDRALGAQDDGDAR